MKKLTEEMVIARTKTSDLGKIKRFNCWGNELADVTLLRRMPSVEVLSLSINKISGLSDFQYCPQLQELYVRQNQIKDLNQICYLQGLRHLKALWLGENPCASVDGYRLAVLRALPQLQKLDNVTVTPEELSEAARKGRVLIHPEDQQESEEEYETPPQHYGNSGYREQQNYEEQYYRSPERSPPRQEQEYENEQAQYYDEPEENGSYPSSNESPRRQSDRRNYSPEQEGQVYYDDRRSTHSYDQEPVRQAPYYDPEVFFSRDNQIPVWIDFYPEKQRPAVSNTNSLDETRISPESPREPKMPVSHSAGSMKEYANGDRYSQNYQQDYRQENDHVYEHPQKRDVRERCDKNSCPANLRPPFNRRPVTRNSNILSAVLCLVKELDYPSLEVVEMAVRCRMDELEA